MNPQNKKLMEDFFTTVSITDELCATSIDKYRDSIKKFLSILKDKLITELDNSDFDTFTIEMKKNGASGSRISNVISAMKRLLLHLHNNGILTKVDLEKIRKPKIARREVNYLTEEEIPMLLNVIRKDIEKRTAIRKVRMMALIVLLLQTGARIGEALSIKLKGIDRINMEIPIIGKGSKPRSLYISEDTIYWIDRYLATRKSDNEFLFTTLNGKSRWQQTDVGRSFKEYRAKSGITKHFTLHTLRHTTATQWALKDVSMPKIQRMLGHDRLDTTVKYYVAPAEKNIVKKIMQDEHYRFIPKDAIYGTSLQNSNTADAPSSLVPCPHPDNTCT